MDSDTKEMWSKIVVGLVFYIIILTIASFLLLPNFWPFGAISWFLILIFGIIFLIRWQMENVAYICPKCNYAFKLKTVKDIMSPNRFNKKLLRCPGCDERVWCKAVSVKPVEYRIDTPFLKLKEF